MFYTLYYVINLKVHSDWRGGIIPRGRKVWPQTCISINESTMLWCVIYILINVYHDWGNIIVIWKSIIMISGQIFMILTKKKIHMEYSLVWSDKPPCV